jgi:hypothetical protein
MIRGQQTQKTFLSVTTFIAVLWTSFVTLKRDAATVSESLGTIMVFEAYWSFLDVTELDIVICARAKGQAYADLVVLSWSQERTQQFQR